MPHERLGRPYGDALGVTIDDLQDVLDETVWYYYDPDGNVTRIVRRRDLDRYYRSKRLIYNNSGQVQDVNGERRDEIDELEWHERPAHTTPVYALTDKALSWNDAWTYAESRGGTLATADVQAYNGIHDLFLPEPGYGSTSLANGEIGELSWRPPEGQTQGAW